MIPAHPIVVHPLKHLAGAAAAVFGILGSPILAQECTVDDDCPWVSSCYYPACVEQTCEQERILYGDVDHNTNLNIFDIFCVVNAFGGTFCAAERNIDIEPCDAPNGVINLFDGFAVENAIDGDQSCCEGVPPLEPGGPASAPGSRAAGEPRVFWVPQGGYPEDYVSGETRVFAYPGDHVCMELWIQGDGGFDSAGLQVRVNDDAVPQGSATGTIQADCSTVTIDSNHFDYVGAAGVLSAWSIDRCDVGSGGDVGWLVLPFGTDYLTVHDAPGGAYIGEVCYDVSSDATGEFLIDYIAPPALETIVAGADQSAQMGALFDPLMIHIGPPNDDCVDAQSVTDGTYSYNTTGATTDGAWVSCNLLDDVWFEYAPTCRGLGGLIITATNGQIDVYWGETDDCPVTDYLQNCDNPLDLDFAIWYPSDRLMVRLGNTESGPLVGDITFACWQECADAPAGSPEHNGVCGSGWPHPDFCLMWYCDPYSGCYGVHTDPNDPENTTDGNLCDDGLYCTTNDACLAGECVDGNPRCPYLACDEDQDECAACEVNGDCDDDLFCSGVETCDTVLGTCDPGSPPCPEELVCDEVLDQCVLCTQAGECGDGLYCNGEEICDGVGHCGAGTPPCTFSEVCMEEGDTCLPDCNTNDIPDSQDIAGETSLDCNDNDIPDECDTVEGTSEDCTGNLIPDECEPDCNENTIADSCDIDDGGSDDVNDNGVPDECECVQVALYGDPDGNGIVNIFDLFCILNGFGGDFSVCSLEDDDLEPCRGNGVINIFDLFAVLSAYGADYGCPICP